VLFIAPFTTAVDGAPVNTISIAISKAGARTPRAVNRLSIKIYEYVPSNPESPGGQKYAAELPNIPLAALSDTVPYIIEHTINPLSPVFVASELPYLVALEVSTDLLAPSNFGCINVLSIAGTIGTVVLGRKNSAGLPFYGTNSAAEEVAYSITFDDQCLELPLEPSPIPEPTELPAEPTETPEPCIDGFRGGSAPVIGSLNVPVDTIYSFGPGCLPSVHGIGSTFRAPLIAPISNAFVEELTTRTVKLLLKGKSNSFNPINGLVLKIYDYITTTPFISAQKSQVLLPPVFVNPIGYTELYVDVGAELIPGNTYALALETSDPSNFGCIHVANNAAAPTGPVLFARKNNLGAFVWSRQVNATLAKQVILLPPCFVPV